MDLVKDPDEFNKRLLELLVREKYATLPLVEKIRQEMENSSEPLESIMERHSVFNDRGIYSSIGFGRQVVLNEMVTFGQFAIGLYDQVFGISSLIESLQKRGWLEIEANFH